MGKLRDFSHMPDQFGGFVAGRTLILDGDGPAYVAAVTVKRLDTAISRFHTAMLTQMFLTKSASVRVHLTSSTSKKAGRFAVRAAKPYQGNRQSKNKPALLEPLRHALTLRENWLPEFEFVRMHHDIEADDAMMHDAYSHGENGLIWSADKDLRMTPFPYWHADKGAIGPSEPCGWLELTATPSGTTKLVGQGPMFFWAQMLMGDTADNVQGIRRMYGRLCGPAEAYRYLKGCTSLDHAADIVIRAYMEGKQNPLPEGQLLWLQRWPGDTFRAYLREYALADTLRHFINECENLLEDIGECESEDQCPG